MNYTINPCNACFKKFSDKDCNINDLNNCFTETVSAFNKVPTNNIVYNDNDIHNNWKNCMLKKMSKMPTLAGEPRNFVNLQLNVAPVFIGKHHFPKLFESTKDINTSLQQCYALSNTNEEKINCWVDAQSLIPIDNPTYDQSEKYTKENYVVAQPPTQQPEPVYIVPPPPVPTPVVYPTYQDVASDKPAMFWSIFVICSIFLAFITIVFLAILVTRKIGV